jgi:hypothetical protein
MNQEKYIGMDVHAATISAAVKNAEGKLFMECVLETKAATILEFIQGLRWNSGVALRKRNLGYLVTRSAEASCQPAGGLRSAQERADEGWQPERSGGCTLTAALEFRKRKQCLSPACERCREHSYSFHEPQECSASGIDRDGSANGFGGGKFHFHCTGRYA